MSYLVLECHPGYAVVLDSEGRFLKAANLNYEEGQTVSEIVELKASAGERDVRRLRKLFTSVASLAACFCVLFLGAWQYVLTPYGSVRMQINPDVQMKVNRLDYVIGLEGLNADGEDLTEDYKFRFKDVDRVSDELADLAVEMGYLTEGGTIHLFVESDHEEWKTTTESRIILELEVHMGTGINITRASEQDDSQEIVIEAKPTAPQQTTPDSVPPVNSESGGSAGNQHDVDDDRDDNQEDDRDDDREEDDREDDQHDDSDDADPQSEDTSDSEEHSDDDGEAESKEDDDNEHDSQSDDGAEQDDGDDDE